MMIYKNKKKTALFSAEKPDQKPCQRINFFLSNGFNSDKKPKVTTFI